MRIFFLNLVFLFSLFQCVAQSVVKDNDGNSYETVIIDKLEWTTSNLYVKTYNNGDSIRHAQSDEDWIDCANKGIGCWCYVEDFAISKYQDIIISGSKEEEERYSTIGILYNWHSINDKRGMLPEKYRLPNDNELNGLIELGADAIRSKTGWRIFDAEKDLNGANTSGLNLKAAGKRYHYETVWGSYGAFYDDAADAYIWSSDSSQELNKVQFDLDGETVEVPFAGASVFKTGSAGGHEFMKAEPSKYTLKGDGYSIRLVKE